MRDGYWKREKYVSVDMLTVSQVGWKDVILLKLSPACFKFLQRKRFPISCNLKYIEVSEIHGIGMFMSLIFRRELLCDVSKLERLMIELLLVICTFKLTFSLGNISNLIDELIVGPRS